MRVFGKALPPNAATLLGTNILLLCLCVPILLTHHAWSLTTRTGTIPEAFALLCRLMAIGFFCQVVFYYSELYNLQIVRNWSEHFWRLLAATGAALLILGGVYAVVPGLSPGRDALVGLAPALIAVVLLTRLSVVRRRRSKVILIGSAESCRAVHATIDSCPEWNMEIVQHYDVNPSLPDLIADGLDRVIICADTPYTQRFIERLTELKMRGICIETAASFYEQATGRVHVDEIRPEWFVFSSGFENGRRKRMVKRCFDLLAGGVIFLCAFPMMVLAALLIVLEGKGPVFFAQDRVGQRGRVFRILKFRTMVPAQPGATPQWTAENDRRITPLGRLMRTFRVDELPQLVNVLRGDMSLVGPRPEQPYFCELLAQRIPYYHQRHTIPPGLTGWAQVRYQYGASIEESKRKLEFDLFYVKHLSAWLDLAILFETLKVVIVGRGAK